MTLSSSITMSTARPDRLSELKTQLKIELERSILLEESDRTYWLLSLPNLNLTAVQNLLEILRSKNQQVDQYIDKALSADQKQEHLTKLRADISRIKQGAFKIEEKSESGQQNQQQEDLLKELDNL